MLAADELREIVYNAYPVPLTDQVPCGATSRGAGRRAQGCRSPAPGGHEYSCPCGRPPSCRRADIAIREIGRSLATSTEPAWLGTGSCASISKLTP
jgi:hypothetical protein